MSVSLPSAFSPLARPDAGWVLSLYPTAGEAGGSFVPSYRPSRTWVPAGQASDAARSRVEAARRAKKKVRVYCAGNRLNRLGTLTYAGAGCHDPAQLREDVGEFFRALRVEVGRGAFPYLWVPEWHKTGHGLHCTSRWASSSHAARSRPPGGGASCTSSDSPICRSVSRRGRRLAGRRATCRSTSPKRSNPVSASACWGSIAMRSDRGSSHRCSGWLADPLSRCFRRRRR